MQPLKRDKKKVKNVKTKKNEFYCTQWGTLAYTDEKKKAHISSVMHPPVCRDKLDKTKNKKSNSHGEAREKKKEKRRKKKKNIVRQETEKQVSCVRSWRNYPAFPQKNKKKKKGHYIDQRKNPREECAISKDGRRAQSTVSFFQLLLFFFLVVSLTRTFRFRAKKKKKDNDNNNNNHP